MSKAKFLMLFTTASILLTSLSAVAKRNINNQPLNEALKGGTFQLLYQVFSSYDKDGLTQDTVAHPGDIIEFAANGKAYMHFNGTNDSIEYKLVNSNAVSFGDTPFVITDLGNGVFTLYQNEEERNGDYNRTTYRLKKQEEKQLSYSR